ncbi:MAG: hypothetical protein P1V97_09570, partial [Planctomycetota bacterium]|nr:hypothetical protein [Planctomycetota bacterium]
GLEDEQAGLMKEVAEIDYGLIKAAIEEIEGVDNPFYWEITDRRRHLDYVEPQFQASFKIVREKLLALEETLKA